MARAECLSVCLLADCKSQAVGSPVARWITMTATSIKSSSACNHASTTIVRHQEHFRLDSDQMLSQRLPRSRPAQV